MSKVDWIVYGDGWERTSEDCAPEDVPGWGVLVIAQSHDQVGTELVHGGTKAPGVGYYWYEDGMWYGGDFVGLVDYLANPGLKIVKFGRTIPSEEFHKVCHKAANDPRLPRKSARFNHEPEVE